MSYKILNSHNMQEFLLNIPSIKNFFQDDKLIIKEIGDGNLNYVFLATSSKDSSKSLIIKQAVPYLRCAGEEFALSRKRMTYEIRALKSYKSHVPKIYYSDEEMSIVIMQYLKDHIILRQGLIQRVYYPKFSEHISTFLANTLFYSSSLYLDSTNKRKLMDRFNSNTQLCKLTEDFVFTFAFMPHKTNHVEDNLKDEANKLFNDIEFKTNVLKLKYIFMTQADALLHGDLHTGSIMINEKETYIIDPEFAFIGPFGFDIGALVANLLSSYISHIFVTQDKKYQEWILQTIKEIYQRFEEKFLTLWNNTNESALINPNFSYNQKFKQEFMKQIFQQSIGFAGCKMTRRVFGIAGVEEIRGIKDPTIRKSASVLVLKIGTSLVNNYHNLHDIDDLISFIKANS